MKLTLVGGGSTYTPELVHGLVPRAAALGIDRIVMLDPRSDRLEPVVGFCQRMARALVGERAPAISGTSDAVAALTDAAFVVNQVRVGGQQGRHEDIRMGLDEGLIGQETTGVGGLAKAMRTIPVVLELAAQVRELAPHAWLLNFTNPSGMVTEALVQAGHARVLGLCNVPIEMHMEIAGVLGRPPSDVALDWVGLNHLGWCRRVLVDGGSDVLPDLIDQIEAGVDGPANLPEIAYPPGFLKALGAIPSSYVRFFYEGRQMHEAIAANKLTRAQEVMALEAELLALYADPSQDQLPGLLSQRGGAWYSRLAVDVLAALTSDTPTTHIVNTPNRGAIAGLPDDVVVEVPCAISKHGVAPQPRGAVDPAVLGLIQIVKAYERLGVEAARATRREHRRARAWLALLANPLVPDAHAAKRLLDRLVARGIA